MMYQQQFYKALQEYLNSSFLVKREFNDLVLMQKQESVAYAIKLERSKYRQVKEYRVSLYKFNSDDEYGTTSPDAVSQEVILPFALQKKIATASPETEHLKEKTKWLYWVFSAEKDWVYLTNEKQKSIFMYESPKIVAEYIEKFKSKV